MTRAVSPRRRLSAWLRKPRNTKVTGATQHLYLILISFFSADKAAAARITAKNGLEFYAYNVRNSLTDEKLADKFDAADIA